MRAGSFHSRGSRLLSPAQLAYSQEMRMSLEGRVAIVTGSGGGLGRSHVLYLARKGARVVVNDLAQESADRVAAEIVAEGGEALAIAGSVTDEKAMAALVTRVVDTWGRVDI